MIPAYDENNVFARILRGEIPAKRLYEDEFTVAFPDISPKAPVHVLIVPKGAYVSLSDFSANASEEEIIGFTRAVGKIARQLGVVESGYRVLTNIGPHSGQEVPHYHLHLLAGKPLGPILAV
jgi:histidine triad (HIT) family protein